MNSDLQSSKRLLSVLIRLSSQADIAPTHICGIHRLSLFHSMPNAQLFCTSSKNNSQALFQADAPQTQADVTSKADRTEAKRPRALLSATSKKNARKTAPPQFRRTTFDSNPPTRSSTASLSKASGLNVDSTRRSEIQSSVEGGLHQPRELWQIQKAALKKKFGEQGWNPRKKLSPDTMEGIRALHEQYPQKYTTPVLAEQFKVSPEAIRRILKSKWAASPEKMEERRVRWAKRHDRIWDAQAEMGLRPQRTKDRKPEGPERLDEIMPLMPNIDP
jgi:Neugrin